MENGLKAIASEVSNYGACVSIKIENGPFLPHRDVRFPQQRLRVIRLDSADLNELAEKKAAQADTASIERMKATHD